MSKYKNSLAVIMGLVSIGIILGIILTTSFNIDSKSHARNASDKIYTESEISGDSQSLNVTNFNPNTMFVEMVEKVRPSIVSIYTAKNVKVQRNPFYFFFRDQENVPDDMFPQGEMKQEGLGSGIIISEDGYILTNYHVVHDMDELKVRLVDNTEYPAKIIGSDQSTEVALIKIEAENLPIAILGNSDHVRIGEWVVAIGNPLHLDFTVTAGIVSALGRDLNIIDDGKNTSIENFIQTDAAINPGNSGGALVNLKGEVIGINTAIATQTRYYMGYGFAVPISLAKRVIDDLMEYGEFRRGYLGVRIEAVTPVIAEYVGLEKPRGVHISEVLSGSAADKAGLKVGDIVLEVDGVEVDQPNELQARVSMHRPGEKIEMKVWRDKKEKTVYVSLSAMDDISGTSDSPKKVNDKDVPDLGLKLQNLTDAQAKSLNLDGGVVVTNVNRYGPAGEAKLFNGDVIYEIENKSVDNVNTFYELIGGYKSGDVIKLSVRRQQNREIMDRPVYIKLP